MIGECIDIKAIQGYYPPRVGFEIRLKNNENLLWSNFAYTGKVKLREDDTTLGTLDINFENFDISPDKERHIRPALELDYKKLDLIEEKRKVAGDLNLKLSLSLLGVLRKAKAEGFESISEAMGRGLRNYDIIIGTPKDDFIVIPQSKWVKVLNRLDYGNFKIVELLVPSIPVGILDGAINSFEKAKKKLNEGDYSKVLIHCQDVFDKISKETKPIKSKIEERLGKDKFGRIDEFKGKFTHFLGLRHEVALDKEEVVRRDAEMALHTTLALLNYFAKMVAELKEK